MATAQREMSSCEPLYAALCSQVQSYMQLRLAALSENSDINDKEFATLCALKFVLMNQVTEPVGKKSVL